MVVNKPLNKQALGLGYFVFAVLIIFIGVNALLYLVAVVTTHETGQGTWLWHHWSQQALLGTLWLVAGGSLLEWFLLREGGAAVAKMLNAQAVDFASQDNAQRQFIKNFYKGAAGRFLITVLLFSAAFAGLKLLQVGWVLAGFFIVQLIAWVSPLWDALRDRP